MTERSPRAACRPEVARVEGYEPPRVEQALTPAALEREMLYAGGTPVTQDDPG